MITTAAEKKIYDYLKSVESLEGENIVMGISDSKRELPCIVVHCDSATEYPGTPMTAEIFILNVKIMVLQSNTEALGVFKDRSGEVRSAIAAYQTMKESVNSNTSSNLFAYGFRNLKTQPSVEEQHFMDTYEFEMVAS